MIGEGLLARIFQHETDHLDGMLYIDRLDEEGRRDVMAQLRRIEMGLAEPGATPRDDGRILAACASRSSATTPWSVPPLARCRTSRTSRSPSSSRTRRGLRAGVADSRRPPSRTPRARWSCRSLEVERVRRRGGLDALARAGARRDRGGRVRRDPPARRPGHPAARRGQPPLLAAAAVARRGPRPARDPRRGRGHGRHRDADGRGDGHRADPGDARGRRSDQGEDAGSLGARLAELGAPLLVETLRGLDEGTIEPRPQDDTAATYAPKLAARGTDDRLGAPADAIVRRVRAFAPAPGAVDDLPRWTIEGVARRSRERIGGDVLAATPKRAEIRLSEDETPVDPGVGGDAVALLEVAPAGRRRMTGGEWARGARIQRGEQLT